MEAFAFSFSQSELEVPGVGRSVLADLEIRFLYLVSLMKKGTNPTFKNLQDCVEDTHPSLQGASRGGKDTPILKKQHDRNAKNCESGRRPSRRGYKCGKKHEKETIMQPPGTH